MYMYEHPNAFRPGSGQSLPIGWPGFGGSTPSLGAEN